MVENRNRGIFAEWLVGQALGAIGPEEYRQEWDAWDLVYGPAESKVEVKAAGLGQSWPQDQPSVPRFDIAPREWTWDPLAKRRVSLDPPARVADVNVFCLHTPFPATSENVLERACWKFWVLSSRQLDREVGEQQSVGEAKLKELTDKKLTERVSWHELPEAVDRCLQGGLG